MIPRGWKIVRRMPRLLFQSSTPFSRSPVTKGHQLLIYPSQQQWSGRISSGQYLQIRSVSSDDLESGSDEDIEIDSKEDVVSSEVFRSFLYPEENQPLFKQLNEAGSVQDIFVFLHKHKNELNPVLVSQAVMVLWDMQRLFHQFCTEEFLADSVAELKSYIKAVNGHPDFEALLRSVGEHCDDLGPDPLTCLLLYLGKMGVDLRHPVMQKLLIAGSKKIKEFPLTALSRFLVSVQHGYNMKSIEWTRPTVPIVIEKLKSVQDAEEFRLLTICLSHLTPQVTSRIFDTYICKLRELLADGTIGKHTPKVVIKILNFMNFARFYKPPSDLINHLMLCLEGTVSQLRLGDITNLIRTTENFMQPAKVAEEVEDYVINCLAEMEPLTLPVDLFNSSFITSSPHFPLPLIEKLIDEHIKSASFPINMVPLFKLLRNIKTPNRDLCDRYWNGVTAYLKKFPKDYNLLLNVSFKYMHFNNNMGGTYRNKDFESVASENLLELMRSPLRFMTTMVSRSSSFLVAYNKDGLPPELLEQVLNMGSQFSIVDCHNISRGVKMATSLKSGMRNPVILDQIVKLSSMLSSSIRGHLSQGTNLSNNDSMMRIYQNIRGTPGTDLHEQLLCNSSMIKLKDLTGRVLKDLSASFISNRTLVPAAMDVMQEFIIQEKSGLMGVSIERFLALLYSLGFHSSLTDECVKHAGEVIMRDCGRLNVLSVLNSALALNFYMQIPMELVHFIFTVEFLERVDRELELCYSRAVYPVRVRQLMMELNRGICLDLPQADVPWFHEKYCQENIHLLNNISQNSAIHNEVLNTLCSVTGGSEFIKQSTYSSYYYNIDFEIILDEHERPINLKENRNLSDRDNLSRVAILLNRDANYTNGTVQLNGPVLLRRRHLEILGYRQVEISRFVWQAMYMADEASRQKFIAEQIWPHRRRKNPENDFNSDVEDLVLT
ncbi:FAST kinase domain-containing protein 1, mitochondrial [Neocloeon triangulifer]|uniref:FAST kinase domain-containing protein 1, mitochondrial n=1 Tax=Neocloeon triangulifer TaxID=2078957 RepID=UPI00286F7D02|nr:FAST kinase domain-containing protein 1, mitochondrial [Neocloeon triangulifer]